MKGYGGLWGLALAGRAIARLPVSRGLATSSCAKHQAPSTKHGTNSNQGWPHDPQQPQSSSLMDRDDFPCSYQALQSDRNVISSVPRWEIYDQVSARDIFPCWSAQCSLWLHIEELRPCRFALQASKPYSWAILYSCWTCSLDSRLFQSIAGLCQGFLGCQPQTTM